MFNVKKFPGGAPLDPLRLLYTLDVQLGGGGRSPPPRTNPKCSPAYTACAMVARLGSVHVHNIMYMVLIMQEEPGSFQGVFT